jgi:hypothetical protein
MTKNYVVEVHARIETKRSVEALRSVASDVQEWLYTELDNADFEPTDVTYEVKEVPSPLSIERKFESFDELIGVLFEEKQASANNSLDDHVQFEMADGLPVKSFTLIRQEGEKDRVVLSDSQ